MSIAVRLLVMALCVVPCAAQSIAPPPQPSPPEAASPEPDIPARFGPVPGTTEDDLARWESMLRDAFLDPDRPRPARLTMIARLESLDIVDLVPAIVNVGRTADVRDVGVHRRVGDLYAWWQSRSARTPAMAWAAATPEAAADLAVEVNGGLGRYWESKHRARGSAFDELRDKIAARLSERPAEVFVPSVAPVDGDERAVFEHTAHLVRLRDAWLRATRGAGPTRDELLAARSVRGFLFEPNASHGSTTPDEIEDDILRLVDEVGAVELAPALVCTLHAHDAFGADGVAAAARLLDLWSQRTGAVPAIDFPTAPDAPAERVAALARLASWLEATIRDPHALRAWRADVADAPR